MPDYAVIHHRMSLLLRLTDTTTGGVVAGGNVTLLRDGKVIHPMQKDGNYIFMDSECEDFSLVVRAFGFEEKTLSIRCGELDKALPAVEAHLIPDGRYAGALPCHTLEGKLMGIGSIDAVKAGDAPCLIREFDERKRLMTIFNPHNLELGALHYAVVNPDEETYEAFTIQKSLSLQQIKIDRRLEREFGNHFPVSRMVFGAVGEDGSYTLRVRNNSSEARWIVRYTLAGEELFQAVDFNAEEPQSLGAGKGKPAAKGEEA